MRRARFIAGVWLSALLLASTAGAAGDLTDEEQERISELLSRGAELAAEEVAERVWLVSGNSNTYLIDTPDGSVLIDTGLAPQAARTRELLLERVPKARPRAIVLTHAHPDHTGGLALWRGQGVAVVAHRSFVERNRDQVRLMPFRNRRARVLWRDVMPEDAEAQGPPYEAIVPDILVDDQYSFYLGGTTFEVIATPGAEGPDSVSVWVPRRRMLFTGDALGPTAGAFPNLFTLRGENLRSAVPLLDSIERMRALRPEILFPGHFEPIRGREKIDALLRRTADAIRYVHDATVAGMNEGKDVWTLMEEIALPPELPVSEQYGRVPWGVRAIWESYTGWFRYESTTELYSLPPRAVYAELAGLSGGPDALAERASVHVVNGDPVRALHLAEVALAADAGHVGALEARLGALERLAHRDAGGNFQVAGWLRHRIGETRAALARARQAGGETLADERASPEVE